MLALYVAAALTAQPGSSERFHVDWVAPDSCPNRSQLAAALESSVPPNRTFFASVRIDEPHNAEQRWRAVVSTTTDGTQRMRVVDATDCVRVSDAALLVVTLAATALSEPDDTAPPLAASQATKNAVEEAAPAPPPEDSSSSGGSPPPARLRLGLRFQPLVGGNVGVLPTPSVSFGLAITVLIQAVRLELSVAQWLQSAGEPMAGLNGRFSLTSVKLKGCFVFETTKLLRLGPCVSAEGGPLTAEGLGVATPTQKVVPWGAALVGTTLGLELGEFVRPWATLEVGLNLFRPQFVVSTVAQPQVVHQVQWPVGRLSVGLEFFIP